jgi:hypothetical protein
VVAHWSDLSTSREEAHRRAGCPRDHDAHTQGKDDTMSQSTRSGSKHAQRLSTDEQEVKDALLDHSEHGTSWIFDQIDSAEDQAARP